MTPPTDLLERRDSLFAAIAHGDAEHKAWLKEAIDAHFAGEPVPACRGSGWKEATIEALQAEVARKDVVLTTIANNNWRDQSRARFVARAALKPQGDR